MNAQILCISRASSSDGLVQVSSWPWFSSYTGLLELTTHFPASGPLHMLFLHQHCSCRWSSMAGFLACLQSQMKYFTFRLPLPKPYSFLLSTCHTLELSISLVASCCCLVAKSCPTLATPWTVTRQAPQSMGFLRQEYWIGCHFFLRGIFPTQGLNLHLLHWLVDSLPLSHQGCVSFPWNYTLPKERKHACFIHQHVSSPWRIGITQ